ncbi:MAG: hypothetical protein OXI24_01955, partial [Candidatus Poribacteria bacterium]|nr:hypothetical protein [Candidatus Poribacteria bacterium]
VCFLVSGQQSAQESLQVKCYRLFRPKFSEVIVEPIINLIGYSAPMRLGNRIYRAGVKCSLIFLVYQRLLLYHNFGLAGGPNFR